MVKISIFYFDNLDSSKDVDYGFIKTSVTYFLLCKNNFYKVNVYKTIFCHE